MFPERSKCTGFFFYFSLLFFKHNENMTFECSLNILKQLVTFKKC